MEKLKIGVVGAGNIAKHGHLPAYKKCYNCVHNIVPKDILDDYIKTRKRNFEINKYYFDLAKEGFFDFQGYHFRIIDLPGTYSLSTYTPEEIYVRKHIIEETPETEFNW